MEEDSLGTTLTEYREQAGLSQREAGALVHVNHGLIARWENDQNRPQPWALDMLAKAYDVNVYEKFLLYAEAGYLPEDFPDPLLDMLMHYALLPHEWRRAADQLLNGMGNMLAVWNIQQDYLLEPTEPRQPPSIEEMEEYWHSFVSKRYHRRDQETS